MKLLVSLLVLAAFIAPAIPAEPAASPELTCEISISPKLDANNGFPASLIIKNVSQKPVRICTMCQGWRSEGAEGIGTYEISFTPESWKSDSPSLEELSKHIVTLAPGETVSLPFTLRGAPYIKITAGYGVSKAFAEKLGIWHGSTQTIKILHPGTSP